MLVLRSRNTFFMNASQEWNDKNFVLNKIKENGEALEYASDDLKNDKEVVLVAVQENGLALLFASYELKKDREILSWAKLSRGESLWRKCREWSRLKRICEFWEQQTMKATFDANGNATMQGRGAKRAREEFEVDFS